MDEKKKEEAIKAIRAAFGDDKDGADKAIKAAFPPAEEDKKETKAEEKSPTEQKNAETEKKETKAEDKPAPKAEEDPEKKKEEAKALAARAAGGDLAAITRLALDGQAEVARLRAEIATKEEKHERTTILATRPDFTAEQLELLSMVSLDEVKKACAKWPRNPMSGKLTPPASISATGTRGASNSDEHAAAAQVPQAERDYIARKMGMDPVPTGIRRTNGGRTLELGAMTPEQARKWLAEHPNPYEEGAAKEGAVR